MIGHLAILHASGAEELRELTPGRHLLGREESSWFPLADPAVSRRHALLVVDGGTVTLEPLPSRNPTLVNGRAIDTPTPLAAGDEVLLGRTLFRLRAGSPSLDAARQQPTERLGAAAVEPVHLVARSAAMQAILDEADRVARSPLPVLVAGESGVGKELLARRLHERSGRRGRFVVLNCPALPPSLAESELFGVEPGVATGVTAREGLLVRADGGTLFLDEVGDLPLELQAKLLRFLQDKTVERVGGRKPITVDVRILSATNRELERDIADGRFRRDLYFRLAGVRLLLPPLRERRDDVRPLAEEFLARAAGPGRRFSVAALAALEAHPFPGNVRELEAVVARSVAFARGEEIDVADLRLGETAASAPATAADDPLPLLARLDDGPADFWADVHAPWRRRELPRPLLEALVKEGLRRSGGSARALARRWRIEADYRRFVDFLRNAGLSPSRGADD